jgi:hypothetical protein
MAIDIQNTVVDVIYDETEIHHVLAPNTEGVRGVPAGKKIIRETIQKVKGILNYYGYDLAKIEDYETELERDQEQNLTSNNSTQI